MAFTVLKPVNPILVLFDLKKAPSLLPSAINCPCFRSYDIAVSAANFRSTFTRLATQCSSQ